MASHPYQRTHRWISFQVDLRGAGSDLWLLLGEAATTAIEGNTLSRGCLGR